LADKEQALFKIFGSFGRKVTDIHIDKKTKQEVNSFHASCGKCNKTIKGYLLKEKEQKIESQFHHYRLTYHCPDCGEAVVGGDV